MNRTLFPACLLLCFFGCERSTFAPEPPLVSRIGQKVIVSGVDEENGAYVDYQGYRVGGYFDFTPYDSLNITFTAQRYAPGEGTVPFSIKVGPGYYVRCSLTGQKQDFAYFVPVPELSKARFAAMTFFVPDSVSPLFVSHLRVIGWYTY